MHSMSGWYCLATTVSLSSLFSKWHTLARNTVGKCESSKGMYRRQLHLRRGLERERCRWWLSQTVMIDGIGLRSRAGRQASTSPGNGWHGRGLPQHRCRRPPRFPRRMHVRRRPSSPTRSMTSLVTTWRRSLRDRRVRRSTDEYWRTSSRPDAENQVTKIPEKPLAMTHTGWRQQAAVLNSRSDLSTSKCLNTGCCCIVDTVNFFVYSSRSPTECSHAVNTDLLNADCL